MKNRFLSRWLSCTVALVATSLAHAQETELDYFSRISNFANVGLTNPLRGLMRSEYDQGHEVIPLRDPTYTGGTLQFHFSNFDRAATYTNSPSRTVMVPVKWKDLELSVDKYTLGTAQDPIAAAIARSPGQRVAIGIRVIDFVRSSQTDPSIAYPAYLDSGSAAFTSTRGYRVPDFNSEYFLSRFEVLLNRIAAYYPNQIAFLYIGEDWQWQTPYGGATNTVWRPITPGNANRLLSAHVNAFPETPHVLYLTDQCQTLLDHAIQLVDRNPVRPTRIGWHSRGFGFGYFAHPTTLNQDTLKRLSGVGPVVASGSSDLRYTTPTELNLMTQQLTDYGVSLVISPNSYQYQWEAVSDATRKKFLVLADKAGFKLHLNQVQVERNITPGTDFSVSTEWINQGIASVYAPLCVRYLLVPQSASSGGYWSTIDKAIEVGRGTIDGTEFPAVLADGDPTNNTDNTSLTTTLKAPGDLPPGNYTLRIALSFDVDDVNYNPRNAEDVRRKSVRPFSGRCDDLPTIDLEDKIVVATNHGDPTGIVRLIPEKDATVMRLDMENSQTPIGSFNRGTRSELEVYSIDPNNSNSNRSYSYLRFNLNSMKDTGIPVSKIARVRLKFYYSGTVPGSLSQFVVPTFDVRILDGSPAWDESTITWNNNALGLGTSVGAFTPQLYTQAQIDVTSQVKNRLTAADPSSVTFAIDEPAPTKNLSFFGSREGVSLPEAMPYLEFEYVPDQPFFYTPEIDTYLRGGSFAAQTYGTQTTMTMKDAFQDEFERDVFLQFKVANLVGRTSVRQATLQLYVTNREQNATIPFTVRGEWNVYDAAYWEPRLNWTKYRSSPTNPPWRVTGTATQNGIVELDVTDWLNDRLSRSKSVFSFMVIGTASNGQPINRGLDFATKENADPAKRPQLIIVP